MTFAAAWHRDVVPRPVRVIVIFVLQHSSLVSKTFLGEAPGGRSSPLFLLWVSFLRKVSDKLMVPRPVVKPARKALGPSK
jgi:hypothetical protein